MVPEDIDHPGQARAAAEGVGQVVKARDRLRQTRQSAPSQETIEFIAVASRASAAGLYYVPLGGAGV
jgi:hypothetical protein